MSIRVLQLTDLHLTADAGVKLMGVPTHETFAKVLKFIRSTEAPFDQIVITGDLVHDGSPEAYTIVRGMLGDWLERCRMIPGNHDDREAMRRVFPDLLSAGDGSLHFSCALGDWRLIGLDSLIDGEVLGRIDAKQLEWLKQELSKHAGAPTVLFLHHPPVAVHCGWMDAIGLQEPGELLDLIVSASQVKCVCAGHVHHEFAGRIGDVPVLTSPSTSVQFDPAKEEPVADRVPPGFRVLELDGNGLRTQVFRLSESRWPSE